MVGIREIKRRLKKNLLRVMSTVVLTGLVITLLNELLLSYDEEIVIYIWIALFVFGFIFVVFWSLGKKGD